MATKPTPGGSDGTYGTELNAFLDESLASDGKVKDGAVFSTSAAPTVDAGVANKLYNDGSGTDFSGLGNDSNGFHTFNTSAGSFILQWGKETVGVGASATVTFDQAFTACFQVVPTGRNTLSSSVNVTVNAINAANFTVLKPTNLTSISYIAVGR